MSAPGSLERVSRWAADSLGPGVKLGSVKPLRGTGSPWLLEIANSNHINRAVLKAGSLGMREELTTEAAALRLAEENGLPAPRVLASDLDGNEAGCIAVIITYIDGSDRIPVAADPDRLRSIGAAAAAIHSIRLTPTEQLPLRERPMPWINFSIERLQGRSPMTPLLARGDRLLGELPHPHPDCVFVHGDLWAGNLLWHDGTHVATIDWEAAGAGSYGVASDHSERQDPEHWRDEMNDERGRVLALRDLGALDEGESNVRTERRDPVAGDALPHRDSRQRELVPLDHRPCPQCSACSCNGDDRQAKHRSGPRGAPTQRPDKRDGRRSGDDESDRGVEVPFAPPGRRAHVGGKERHVDAGSVRHVRASEHDARNRGHGPRHGPDAGGNDAEASENEVDGISRRNPTADAPNPRRTRTVRPIGDGARRGGTLRP